MLLGLVFVLVASGVSFYYFSATPRFAVYEIVYAIKTKDRSKFEKRVDVESIIGTVVEDVASELNKNGNGRAGIFVNLIKPRLSQIAREQVEEAIFEKKNTVPSVAKDFPNDPGLGAFSSVSRGISFKGLGDTYQKGAYMITPANFVHEASQKEIRLDLKMVEVSGKWKLVEVGNLVEAFKSVRQGDAGDSSRQVSGALPLPVESVSPAPQAPVGD